MSIKASKLTISAGLLSIFLCGAVFLFLQAYNRFEVNNGKKEALSVRLKVLQQQKREAERKARILAKLNDFVHRAGSFGLEEGGWDVYEVYINEPVTFAEMEQMLNQCTNSADYYFKPISLYAKTGRYPGAGPAVVADEKGAGPKEKMPQTSVDLQGGATGDVLLTLKGAFVVRR
ncbi:MAG: hypothetical protein GY697_05505 [Desulfobacterales bacterium]|nr:hypothetical protein [Desulfobacterales bacterium]